MNRITAFSNAAEFQALFGKTEHGTRRNAILLSFLKSKTIWDWCRKTNWWFLLGIKSMAELKRVLFLELDLNSRGKYPVCLKGWGTRSFRSDMYETDEYNGIPVDETASSGDFIRYINKETDKVYKMRSGKFLRKVILENELGKALPQQVLTWMLEELVADWRVQCENEVPKYHLVIDEDFASIYDRDCCCGSFGSCMTNEGYHTFYNDAVDAKAASLRDEDDIIIARCIIYTKVYDEDGNEWRLAERQYATKELHKQLLVNALVEGGHIDGYKRVGADCGAANSFVSNDGEDLSDKTFSIRCNLDWGDTVSYQDSFKWFNMDEQKAYNDYSCNYDEGLDTTGGCLPGEWDDWHDRYVRATETVYYHGTEYQCDEDDLDDFTYFQGEYYHEDDIIECPECCGDFLNPDYYDSYGRCYSEITREWYCCEACKEKDEERYIKERWFWSDFDEDYVERKEMLTTYLHLDGDHYVVQTVILQNVNKYVRYKMLEYYNGILVDDASKLKSDDKVSEELARMNVELLTV